MKILYFFLGIDYLHPALGGCFGPGCKVEYGYNHLENTWDPRDVCSGHGTHVAGSCLIKEHYKFR